MSRRARLIWVNWELQEQKENKTKVRHAKTSQGRQTSKNPIAKKKNLWEKGSQALPQMIHSNLATRGETSCSLTLLINQPRRAAGDWGGVSGLPGNGGKKQKKKNTKIHRIPRKSASMAKETLKTTLKRTKVQIWKRINIICCTVFRAVQPKSGGARSCYKNVFVGLTRPQTRV